MAFTGAYSDLSGLPTLNQGTITQDTSSGSSASAKFATFYSPNASPVSSIEINNGTLTIQKNGTDVQTFSANQSSNATANITVPTKTSQLTNDSGFITTDNTRVAKAGDTMTGQLLIDTSALTDVPLVIKGDNANQAHIKFLKSDGSNFGYLYIDKNGNAGAYFNSYKPFAFRSEIPTNTNQLTNGAGFITSAGSANPLDNVLDFSTNLNNLTTVGFYSVAGGNSVTNKPSGVGHFGMIQTHNAGGGHYAQILLDPTNKNAWIRYCQGGTSSWTEWTKIVTDTVDSNASSNTICKRDSTGSFGITNLYAGNSSNWLGILAAATACKNYANTAYAPIYASSYPGTSARRFKENIKALTEEEAEKILDVEVVSFDYKADMGISTEEERHGKRGVIAEQVEPIIPSVVTYREEEDGETRIYGVDYSKFVPYLIKMVQLQQKQIDNLMAEISALKGDK